MRFSVVSNVLVAAIAATIGVAHAKLAPAPAVEPAKVEAEKKKKADAAKKEAEALARAQDRVVEHYKRSKGLIPEKAEAPAKKRHAAARIEKLTCMLGTEDRHARIGVELKNGHVESFHNRLRDECLNQELFPSMTEARVVIEEWRRLYNRIHPHSSLGFQSPDECATKHERLASICAPATPALRSMPV